MLHIRVTTGHRFQSLSNGVQSSIVSIVFLKSALLNRWSSTPLLETPDRHVQPHSIRGLTYTIPNEPMLAAGCTTGEIVLVRVRQGAVCTTTYPVDKVWFEYDLSTVDTFWCTRCTSLAYMPTCLAECAREPTRVWMHNGIVGGHTCYRHLVLHRSPPDTNAQSLVGCSRTK